MKGELTRPILLPSEAHKGSSLLQNAARSTGHFARNYKLAFLGAIIVIAFVLTALLAPWISPRDPNEISLANTLESPGRDFLLGTDNHGRDQLSRLIHGARISLTIAISAVVLGTVTGVTLGITAGWFSALQTPLMRLVDVLLAFPGIIIALTVIAILGTGLENVVVAIAISMIPDFGRLVNGLTLSVRENTYIEAGIAIGASNTRILSRYILPNILAPIVVQVSLLIPGAIMTAAGLSFLGLGVTPPTAEWGAMLQDSLTWARMAPHMMIFPGLALMLVVFGFNVMGDGLRDLLDPRVRK
jgi:peptide/nickel transport system permease protein